MAEFFIEILSEEIPARFQLQAMQECRNKFYNLLSPLFPDLSLDSIKGFVTPRRLGVVIFGLPLQTMPRQEERRGPKQGAPEGAIQGFLKSVGRTQDQCTLEKGYWMTTFEIPPESVEEILPRVLLGFLKIFPWPKTMRWPGSSLPWVRPIRSILCILEGKPLLFEIPELGLQTASVTRGHRFLANHEISVSSFEDYQKKLQQAFVSIDPQERQIQIHEQLASLAQKKRLVVETDEALERETAGLVEHPVCLLGKIDPLFLELPREVLTTSLRHHQKSFTLLDSSQKAAPFFGIVANCPPKEEMLEGYERVLKARLSDARFFYEQDLKTPLSELSARLQSIVFHQRLGSLQDKVERLKAVMSTSEGREAASLSKADLLTTMVGEFPELQGVMGRIYALKQGYSRAIAEALQEHYQPQGPQDACPIQPLSVELSLADKIDTLTGFFAIGELPTGSKDPYALRRAALGVVRLIRENAHKEEAFKELDVMQLIHQAQAAYEEQGLVVFQPSFQQNLREFFVERLKALLKQESIRFDCVDAVASFEESSLTLPLNVWSLSERARSLQDFLETDEGEALKIAFNRAHGILKESVGQKRDFAPLEISTEWDEAEKSLLRQLDSLEETSAQHLRRHHYTQLMKELAALRPDIDAFFVLKINDENPVVRERRHQLLRSFIFKTRACADFSKIEG